MIDDKRIIDINEEFHERSLLYDHELIIILPNNQRYLTDKLSYTRQRTNLRRLSKQHGYDYISSMIQIISDINSTIKYIMYETGFSYEHVRQIFNRTYTPFLYSDLARHKRTEFKLKQENEVKYSKAYFPAIDLTPFIPDYDSSNDEVSDSVKKNIVSLTEQEPQCARCESKNELEYHKFKNYFNDPDELICIILCKECHKLAHLLQN